MRSMMTGVLVFTLFTASSCSWIKGQCPCNAAKKTQANTCSTKDGATSVSGKDAKDEGGTCGIGGQY